MRMNKKNLSLTIGGDVVDAEVAKAEIHSGATESDFVSFASARAGGGRDYTMELTLAIDPSTGTLWDRIWSHSGEDVAFTLKPVGGQAASPSTPWFTGTVTISEPDGLLIGTEADASNSAVATVEVVWSLTGKPTRVVS